MRRTALFLGGHLPIKEYHEWHLHEPLLIKYDEFRILDDVPMSLSEAYFWDAGGYGRHLDPIIDDPRLTHKQRVCRLYKWALKEVRSTLTRCNYYKFNIAMKVVRNRFEKYRYVQDAAMCDMMVRETQKYLRETCHAHYMKICAGSPYNCQWWTNPMFHPDHAQCYDHWTPTEVLIYDDAKLHRFRGHHAVHGDFEYDEKFGGEEAEWWQPYYAFLIYCIPTFLLMKNLGVFWDPEQDQRKFDEFIANMDVNLQQFVEHEERVSRSRYSSASVINFDWDRITGFVNNNLNIYARGGRLEDYPDYKPVERVARFT